MANTVSIVVRSFDETTAGFDKAKDGFGKALGGMKALAISVGPALAGPLVAAAGASAAAFASVGTALGAFGLAVAPQLKLMTDLKADLSSMAPATREAAVSFRGLKGDLDKWSESLAPKTMPIFTKGLEAMRTALPALTPLVETAASALTGFMDSISKGVEGGGFKSFMNELNGAAKKTLPDFLDSLKNIGSGFAGILRAFLPFAGEMTGGLEKITKKFAEFGQGLKDSAGFQEWMDGVKEKIPAIMELFGNLGKIIGDIISALAPFSGVGLAVAGALAAMVAAIPQGAMDFIAPTIAAIVVAVRAWAIAQGILNVVMSANPVGAVIMGLVLLGTALVVAYQKSQTFRVMVAAAFEGVARVVLFSAGIILQGLKFIVGGVLDMVGTIVHGLESAFGGLPGIGDKFKEAAKGFDSFKKGVDGAFDGAIKKVGEWDDKVKGMTMRVVIQGKIDDLEKKIDKAKKELESVPKGKRAELTAKIDDWNKKLLQAKVALQNTPNKKQALLTSNITDWTNKLKTATSQLKSVPASKRSALLANIADLQSKIRAAKSLLSSLHDKTVTITSYYKKVNAGEAPPYQHYAHGGIVGAAGGGPRSNLSWVGENGPELVSLSPGSTVHTAGDSRRMAAGMGGGDGGPIINVYVQGSIRSDRELVGIIRDEFINGGFRGVVR